MTCRNASRPCSPRVCGPVTGRTIETTSAGTSRVTAGGAAGAARSIGSALAAQAVSRAIEAMPSRPSFEWFTRHLPVSRGGSVLDLHDVTRVVEAGDAHLRAGVHIGQHDDVVV